MCDISFSDTGAPLDIPSALKQEAHCKTLRVPASREQCLMGVMQWWIFHGLEFYQPSQSITENGYYHEIFENNPYSQVERILFEEKSWLSSIEKVSLINNVNWATKLNTVSRAEEYCANIKDPFLETHCFDTVLMWWQSTTPTKLKVSSQLIVRKSKLLAKQVVRTMQLGERDCESYADVNSAFNCLGNYADWWFHDGGFYLEDSDPYPQVVRILNKQLQLKPNEIDVLTSLMYSIFSVEINRINSKWKLDPELSKTRNEISRAMEQLDHLRKFDQMLSGAENLNEEKEVIQQDLRLLGEYQSQGGFEYFIPFLKKRIERSKFRISFFEKKPDISLKNKVIQDVKQKLIKLTSELVDLKKRYQLEWVRYVNRNDLSLVVLNLVNQYRPRFEVNPEFYSQVLAVLLPVCCSSGSKNHLSFATKTKYYDLFNKLLTRLKQFPLSSAQKKRAQALSRASDKYQDPKMRVPLPIEVAPIRFPFPGGG